MKLKKSPEELKQNKEGLPKIETVSIQKEILSVGKFNGVNITESDLDEMLANFNELKDIKEVNMRIGHTSDDKPNTKVLRAGTVEYLEKGLSKKTGKPTLIAKLRNVPKQIYEFIQKELLKPVSIEFLRQWTNGVDGKKYSNVLTAIALMGSAQPAVPALADFEISFSEEEADYIKIEYQEDNCMDKEVKELQEKNGLIATELAAKEAERLEVVKQKELAEQELREFKEKVSNKSIIEFIEANPKKILPCEKERVEKLLKALDNDAISFEEKEVRMTLREEFQDFIVNSKDRVEFGVVSEQGKVEKITEFKNEDEKRNYIADEALKLSKDKKISFEEASLSILEKLNK